MRMLLACITGAFALQAAAIETRDARGLQVVVERIDGSIRIDGLAMQIQAASGRDVAQLAARIEQRWRDEGSTLQHHAQSPWKLVTRLHDGRSEVIQWRGSGASARLLHSVVDAMRATKQAAAAPFVLPPQCAWGRVVEGTAGPAAYAQHSAHCRMPPASLVAMLRQRLAAQGWSVQGERGLALQLVRPGIDAELIIAPGQARDESAVVWVSTRLAREPR